MRLSYSSDKLIDYCPRKFQLYKLLDIGQESVREETKHTVYGHSFGAGAAVLLQGGSIEQAIWEAFTQWDARYEGAPKYLQVLFTSLFRLAKSFPFHEYEPLTLPDGKPAIEVGSRLWLDAEGVEDYYVLYADAILLHKPTRKPTIMEVKTTQRAEDAKYLYANSPQSILYSLPLPYLFPEYAEHAWDTVYVINRIPDTWDPSIEVLPIAHRYDERLSALMGILMRYEYIKKMQEHNFFQKTMAGECITYGNPCEFFGVCDSLAMTCEARDIEAQNELDTVREQRIVLDLHIQTLLRDEMNRG